MGRRSPLVFRASLVVLASAFSVGALPTIVRAAGKGIDEASEAEKTQAQKKFKEGSKAFEKEQYDKAIESFNASYEIVASPNAHVMLGRAQRKAGKLLEAYETLQAAVEEAKVLAIKVPKYQQAVDTANAELTEIHADIAVLVIDVANAPPSTTLTVAGRPIAKERWKSVPVLPGKIEVVAKSTEGREARQTVEAAAGSDPIVHLDLNPQPAAVEAAPAAPPVAEPPPMPPSPPEAPPPAPVVESTHPLRPWAFVATGVGVAGLGTFAVAGMMARSTENDLEASCPNDLCAPDLKSKVDKGHTEQTIANIGLAVGIVGTAAAVTLFVIDAGGSSKETALRRRPATARLKLLAGPASAALRGEF